jgi:hypothetical protein
MTGEIQAWHGRMVGKQAATTFSMQVARDEKEILGFYRRRLGLRSDAEVVRVALDLLAQVVASMEMLAASGQAVALGMTQGNESALASLVSALELHPDWFPDERNELLEMARARLVHPPASLGGPDAERGGNAERRSG